MEDGISNVNLRLIGRQAVKRILERMHGGKVGMFALNDNRPDRADTPDFELVAKHYLNSIDSLIVYNRSGKLILTQDEVHALYNFKNFFESTLNLANQSGMPELSDKFALNILQVAEDEDFQRFLNDLESRI